MPPGVVAPPPGVVPGAPGVGPPGSGVSGSAVGSSNWSKSDVIPACDTPPPLNCACLLCFFLGIDYISFH